MYESCYKKHDDSKHVIFYKQFKTLVDTSY